MTKKSTITNLPNDIRAAVPNFEKSTYLCDIIKQAEAGEFHDFKNTTYTCGKTQLAHMLYESVHPELIPIRQAVINGDYDESPDIEDKAAMKKDWLENGGDLKSYEEMFGKD